MHFTSTTVASLVVLASAASAMPTAPPPPQKPSGKFGLALESAAGYDINQIISTDIMYANNSMYFGGLRYQQYSEALILTGAYQGDDTTGGLSFTSFHSSPTGFQDVFIETEITAPVQFTAPHSGSKPKDAVTSPFYFSTQSPSIPATLNYNTTNKFYACQTPELKALDTFQIWWLAANPFPGNVNCTGPINIVATPML